MKRILNGAVSLAALAGMVSIGLTPALADSYDHHQGGDNHQEQHGNGHPAQYGPQHQHRHWHKGGQIAQEDWDRGQPVDYHAHRLHAPPPGYEWRQIGGNFVLAAVATGVIASIIAAAGH